MNRNKRINRVAFTITEMLIAMTVTLLIMGALGQTFAYVGRTVAKSKANLALSNKSRIAIAQIHDDVAQMTMPFSAMEDPARDGYAVYYEGPITDSTAMALGAAATIWKDGSNAELSYFQDSRFGDFDDYLAFTAKAQEGFFTGIVPRYILEENVDESDDPPGDTTFNDYDITNTSDPRHANAFDPVVITSKYAEVIYFVTPEYNVDGGNFDFDASGNPVIADIDANGLPDRFTLHRRVLLIRPDLNVSLHASAGHVAGTLPQGDYVIPGSSDRYTFMQPDVWNQDGTSTLPEIDVTAQRSRAWQFGMAPVHQQCDLSVRWVLDESTGLPTQRVAANSLEDLTQPHNRFAHVRMPSRLLGGISRDPSLTFTTMPLLATGSQIPLLDQALADDLITSEMLPHLRNQVPTQNGFLRPEYALGWDLTHTEVPVPGFGIERRGDDVLADNVLALDLQVFDPSAVSVFLNGSDNAPGASGLDDDGNGTVDDNSELGSANTDDTVVSPNDPAYFDVIRSTSAVTANFGTYVDLGYVTAPGGAARGRGSIKKYRSDASAANAVPTANYSGLDTPFSGFAHGSGNVGFLPTSLFKSGKAVAVGSTLRVYQPTLDTFTQDYERDGFYQGNGVVRAQRPNGMFVEQNASTGAVSGTLWWNTSVGPPDLGSNGRDDNLGDNISVSLVAANQGADDESELETSAPFSEAIPTSVRLRLRLYDAKNKKVNQSSVVIE